MTVLGPCQQDDDLNNMSVVVRIDFGSTSFLSQGMRKRRVKTQS